LLVELLLALIKLAQPAAEVLTLLVKLALLAIELRHAVLLARIGVLLANLTLGLALGLLVSLGGRFAVLLLTAVLLAAVLAVRLASILPGGARGAERVHVVGVDIERHLAVGPAPDVGHGVAQPRQVAASPLHRVAPCERRERHCRRCR